MLARTPGTILNKNGENRCRFLVPDLRGKAVSFSPFIKYDVSCRLLFFFFFKYMILIKFKTFTSLFLVF